MGRPLVYLEFHALEKMVPGCRKPCMADEAAGRESSTVVPNEVDNVIVKFRWK